MWLWLVGYVVGWIVVSVILVLMSNHCDESMDACVMLGLFWPLVLPVVIVFFIVSFLVTLIENKRS